MVHRGSPGYAKVGSAIELLALFWVVGEPVELTCVVGELQLARNSAIAIIEIMLPAADLPMMCFSLLRRAATARPVYILIGYS